MTFLLARDDAYFCHCEERSDVAVLRSPRFARDDKFLFVCDDKSLFVRDKAYFCHCEEHSDVAV